MTAIITVYNTGIDGDFIARWAGAYLVAWPIAFTFIAIVGKRVQRLTDPPENRVPEPAAEDGYAFLFMMGGGCATYTGSSSAKVLTQRVNT